MTRLRVNRLLALLPPDEAAAIASRVETMELRRRQVLWSFGETLQHVYFPVSSAIALLVGNRRGNLLETGIVGCDGMVGLEAFFGVFETHREAIVMVPGETERVPVDVLARFAAPPAILHEVLRRYACTRLVHVAQSAFCDATHSISHRCVRRLLTLHDCAGTDNFPVTQQSLSALLGVRRASVSVAAEKLQQAGLIVYEHGRMHIADRAGLEHESCDCYAEMKQRAEQLLPDTVRH